MISFGSNNINKVLFGNPEVQSVWYGNTKIYESTPQLDAPTNVSVTGTNATFDEVENATSYEFFVDGVSIGTKAEEGITINWSAEGINCDAGIAYKTPEMSDYTQNEMVGAFHYAEGSLFIPSTTISLYFWGKYYNRGADSASYQINNGQVIDATAYTQANPLTLTLSTGDVVTVYSTYED